MEKEEVSQRITALFPERGDGGLKQTGGVEAGEIRVERRPIRKVERTRLGIVGSEGKGIREEDSWTSGCGRQGISFANRGRSKKDRTWKLGYLEVSWEKNVTPG